VAARGNGYFVLHPATNIDLCLDVKAAGTGAGTPLIACSCNGGSNENRALK
jgi:hypothetical protein